MAHFENITLEKGMYSVPGKSFTQVLEELDSSENYRGTSLEEYLVGATMTADPQNYVTRIYLPIQEG